MRQTKKKVDYKQLNTKGRTVSGSAQITPRPKRAKTQHQKVAPEVEKNPADFNLHDSS